MSDHSNENENEEGPPAPPRLALNLKSFPPDLEVVVGTPPNQQIFECHGVLLASYSDYIDSMLAIPMREKSTRRITFPDIEPDIWNKMISFLQPNGSRKMKLSDLSAVLPYYDKYSFIQGLQMCDSLLFGVLRNHKQGGVFVADAFAELLIPTVAMAYELKLEKSTHECIQFAGRVLTKLHRGNYTPHQLQTLIPLVESNGEIVKYLLQTLMGVDCSQLTLNEMLVHLKDGIFEARLLTRHRQIRQQHDLVRFFNIPKLRIQLEGPLNEGDHPLLAAVCDNNTEFTRLESTYPGIRLPGAMQNFWVRVMQLPPEYQSTTQGRQVALRALCPFGKTWQIRVEDSFKRPAHVPAFFQDSAPSSENDAPPFCQILLEWKNNYSSMVPPCDGWKKFVNGERIPTDCRVHYQMTSH